MFTDLYSQTFTILQEPFCLHISTRIFFFPYGISICIPTGSIVLKSLMFVNTPHKTLKCYFNQNYVHVHVCAHL